MLYNHAFWNKLTPAFMDASAVWLTSAQAEMEEAASFMKKHIYAADFPRSLKEIVDRSITTGLAFGEFVIHSMDRMAKTYKNASAPLIEAMRTMN